jgi:hypothetical protein
VVFAFPFSLNKCLLLMLLLICMMMPLPHVVHTAQPTKAHRVLTVHMMDYIVYNTAHDPFLCFVPSRAAATPWAFPAFLT